jgi:NADPH-ferrihemoprotein reductase
MAATRATLSPSSRPPYASHVICAAVPRADGAAQNKRLVIFYGSQTGTAEEYAIRIAKEAKAKFGLSALVCDPEEYDIEHLDALPADCVAVFVMATYGEGEPTDNAVPLMQSLADESFSFSQGEHKLDGTRYVVFGLGNRTYEHYNLVARQLDEHLAAAGAKRIGERGEGDDDRSMEEDYLEWKDGMFAALGEALGVEEGQGGDTPDFTVAELTGHAPEKVYLGARRPCFRYRATHYDICQASSRRARSRAHAASTTPRTRTRRR